MSGCRISTSGIVPVLWPFLCASYFTTLKRHIFITLGIQILLQLWMFVWLRSLHIIYCLCFLHFSSISIYLELETAHFQHTRYSECTTHFSVCLVIVYLHYALFAFKCLLLVSVYISIYKQFTTVIHDNQILLHLALVAWLTYLFIGLCPLGLGGG